MTQMKKIIQETKWLQNATNLSEHISFLYHLRIYGQWATFIFQMVTYNFFIDSVRVFFSKL
jgi:hypothetical protein